MGEIEEMYKDSLKGNLKRIRKRSTDRRLKRISNRCPSVKITNRIRTLVGDKRRFRSFFKECLERERKLRNRSRNRSQKNK
jgi:hypothetical protein